MPDNNMLTHRSDPLSFAPLQDRWAAMLGSPRKNVTVNPKDTLPIITQTLADAYDGKNEELGNRIEHHMTFADNWAIRIVAPVVATNNLTATASRISFIAEIMPEVSPEGVPRCLTYTKESITMQVERRGLGIYVELGWAETAEGMMMLANQIAQISASMVETARIDVLVTLMTAQDHYNAWNSEWAMYGGPIENERFLARELAFWCCSQIMDNGLERLDELIKNDVSTMAGSRSLNTYIIPGPVGSYSRVVPVASVQHWVGGDIAMERINGMLKSAADSLIPTGYVEDNSVPLFMNVDGNMVFLTRPIITHADGPVDPMQRFAQIGEYFDMMIDPRSVDAGYRSSDRDTKAYNETSDQWAIFTQEWVIQNAGMWNRETGQLRPFADAGSSNFSRFREFSKLKEPESIADNQIWFGKRVPGSSNWAPISSWSEVRSLKPAHFQAVGRSILGALARSGGGSLTNTVANYDSAMAHLRSLHYTTFADIPGHDGRVMGEFDTDPATFVDDVAASVLGNYRDHGLAGFLARPRLDLSTTTDFEARYLERRAEADLRPNVRELTAVHDQSYLGPLPIRRVVDPYLQGAALKVNYDIGRQKGGTASMAYLRWAKSYADEPEKSRAENTIAVLERLAAFLSNLFPESRIISTNSSTPYVDISAEQALIELLLGDLRYVGYVAVSTTSGTAAGSPLTVHATRTEQLGAAVNATFADAAIRAELKSGTFWGPRLGGAGDYHLITTRQQGTLRMLHTLYQLYATRKTAVAQDPDADFLALLQDPVFRDNYAALFWSDPAAGPVADPANAEASRVRERVANVLNRYEQLYAPTFTVAGRAVQTDVFIWARTRTGIQVGLEQLRLQPNVVVTPTATGPSGPVAAATANVDMVAYTTITWPANQDYKPIYSHWGSDPRGDEVGVWLVPTAAGNPAVLDTSQINVANSVVDHSFIERLRVEENTAGLGSVGGSAPIITIRGQIGHVKNIGAGILPPGVGGHAVHGNGVVPPNASGGRNSRYQDNTTVRTSRLIGAGMTSWNRSPAGILEHANRVHNVHTNLGDHVAAVESTRSLDALLGFIFLGTPVTRDAMLDMDRNDVYIPWQPIIARPFATYTTYSVLKVRAGLTDIVLGGQPAIVYLSGPTSVVMGVDANTQTMRGSVIAYGKTMVADARCVYHARNIACKDAHGGLDAAPINPDTWMPAEHISGESGSVIVIPEGPEFRGFSDGRFDITGDYFTLRNKYGVELMGKTPYGGAGGPGGPGEGNVQYPLAPWVVERYHLDMLANPAQTDWDGPFVSFGPNAASNAICYRGSTFRKDPQGRWSEHTPGTGHWGAAQGPGNLAVRKGMLKRANHHSYNRPDGEGASGGGSFLNGF